MKKMVVIVRNAAPDDFGGAERFTVFLANELHDLGYQTIVLSRSQKLLHFAEQQRCKALKSWWWGQQSWHGSRMIALPAYLLWQLLLVAYYSYTFRQLNADIVHLNSRDDFIAGSIAGKLQGCRVIWTDHADLKHIFRNVKTNFKNPVGKLVLWASRYTDAITLVSHSEQHLINQQLPLKHAIRDKFTIIHNGAFDRLAQYPHEQQADFTFVYVGRLVIDKGIRELIDAFNKLVATHPDCRLLIVGDGPDRLEFEKEAASQPAIHFIGHSDEPLAYLARADVFVYPTYHEGFSLSLVEAAMMSLPIITTRVGGNPEIIIDGNNGLLIPPRDSDALYVSISRMLVDQKLRERLASSARATYTTSFDFRAIAHRQFVDLYN